MSDARIRRDIRARSRALLTTVWCLFGIVFSLNAGAAAPTDVILVLDNSGSMRNNDPKFLAKSAVSRFVSGLETETRVGILIFDEKVNYAIPLTDLTVATRAAIQKSLDEIDYRGQLTNSPAAIERAIYELKTSARDGAAKVIVFMTDGIVDTGNAAVDTEKTKWMREELAADAADSDIRVFAIAFTENADFFLIQSLAKQTDGEYFRALSPEDLAEVFVRLKEKLEAPPVRPAPPVAAPQPAPSLEPAPVPAPTPSPASTPAPAPAVAGSCLASLVADERIAFEQMAVEAGIPAEQLCSEMMAAPDGTAVVVRPEDPAAKDETLGLILVLAIAAVILAVLVAVVVYFVRRRGSAVAPRADDDFGMVPEAFIKDIHGITNDPAIQIGAKPVMIGRVAGNDPAHLDYFVVNKGTIGRRHSMIKYRDFSFWLIDQGSVNGTFLNGERVEGERQLKHGDRIKFHKYEFEFSMPEMEDAGHTVFADPADLNATMVGEIEPVAPPEDDAFGLTAGAGAAAGAVAAGAVAAGAAAAEPDEDADTALSARQRAEAAASLDEADFDELATGVREAPKADDEIELVTVMPDAVIPPQAGGDAASAGAEGDAADFDAEASAFFGDESFSPVADVDEEMPVFDDAAEMDPAPTSSDEAGDLSESETLLPASMTGEDKLEETSDISLDEFMSTESFQVSVSHDQDLDDTTLLPADVPAIDDVFDITAEGEVDPGGTASEDTDDDDEDDGSESPTVFKS